MRSFQLLLPDKTYALVKAEARRLQIPTTALAQEAIQAWLRDQARKTRHDAIRAYAAETAGSNVDLEPELESATVEHLAMTRKIRR